MGFTTNIKWKGLTALLIAATIGVTIALQEFGSNEMAAEHVLSAAEIVSPALEESNNTFTATNCRYGAGLIASDASSGAWISTLKAGWYLSMGHHKLYSEPDSEFIFTIRTRQVQTNGVRLHEYTVSPPVTDFYYENGTLKPGLGYFLNQHPGATWVVGNEIDIDNYTQDNIMPDLYAEAYHEIYHYIKSVDPTAKVAIGSVLQGTPGRLQYLDIVMDTYQSLYGMVMPIDVWNIHFYVLSERTMRAEPQYADGKIALGTDPNLALFSTHEPALCPSPGLPDTHENDPRLDVYCKAEHDSLRIFSEQVHNLRRWMKERGQQNKPLIVTEYGILYPFIEKLPDDTCNGIADEFGNCFPPERVSSYLLKTTDFLENTVDPSIGYPQDDYRLVQRWAWYSIYTSDPVGSSSNLLVKGYDTNFKPGAVQALSMAGQAYRTQAEKHATINLDADIATVTNFFIGNPADKVTATLTASFRNDGSNSVTEPFTVTFYSDQALTSPIGSVEVNPANSGPIMGCSWVENAETVSIEWPNLPIGIHNYWAKIDSGQDIAESNEMDNVTTRGQIGVFDISKFIYSLYAPALVENE